MLGNHNHTSKSNFRLLDCTNSVEDLIQTSADLGYKGISITDHETVSAHVEAIQVTNKLKKSGKIPEDFQLILGNEVYLVNSIEEVKDNYKSGVTKFPHFILIAKDKKGHEQLRYLSSKAWENSFYTGMMERTPTTKTLLEEVVKNDPGHLIAASACLGSEVNIHLLAIKDYSEQGETDKVNEHRKQLHEFINWCIDVFGKESFFIELQPALSEQQIYCNEKLIGIAEHYGLKSIVTTDTHFLRPEDRIVHKSFLNAKEGEREIDSFYEACYLHTEDEIYERMDYLDKRIVKEAIENTLIIGEMVEEYTILHEPIIPKIDLPNFEVSHKFKPAYDQYEYIAKMAYSESEQDRYIVKLLEDGFMEKLAGNTLSKEKFHEILNRLDGELGELFEISITLNQSMSAYYVTIREIINIIWDDECGGNSLVGSGRGSAAGYLINYLLGVTQINPLNYGIDMPYWRHLHRSRPDVPDIDIDTESSKRPQILQALRNHFGSDKVLQVCTYGTEGSKSALQTACRGLGIDSDIALFISGMIPFERGTNWSLSDCFNGNEEENRKPVKEFIREVEKYPNLKEVAMKLEGTVNKRSIHAGGVILFNEPYYKTNALMTAPNGSPITQYNLSDSEAVGNIKFDLLTVEALDKIRANLDLLIEYDEIDWKDSLRKTFDHYLHPDNINIENPKYYEMLGSGEVMDLFQFSTDIGIQSAIKVKPSNLIETAAANSLMRLMSEGGAEQPIDTFIKYKNNISLWYEEMDSFNLTEDEVKVMEEHLLKLNGVADTQESVMILSMDKRIAGFDIKMANKLRKAIAKKSKKAMEECYAEFFKQGMALGNSEAILKYVWDVQIKRQLGYSFSILHTVAYSIMALQEISLNERYNPLYWQTACLSVNSGGIDYEMEEEDSDDAEEKTKKKVATNYGKVASAIGGIRQSGVSIALPDINKAKFGFIPDIENQSIVFGLKGMNGVGDELVHSIMEHRPYQSFNDFLVRMFDTKIVKQSQAMQLIKGGCFDSFNDRREILKEFIAHTFEPKKQLNMQNMKMLINNKLIPAEHSLSVRMYKYKAYISKRVFKTISKPKDKLFLLDDISTSFYEQHFTENAIVEMVDGRPVISEKLFNKEYDKHMINLKEWMSKPETLQYVNERLIDIDYEPYERDTLGKWEMDSLSYYYHEHELEHVNKEKYDISNFFELPETPIVTKEYVSRGIPRQEYQLTRIAGTVLDKDKNKHSVTILTTDGVVTVKLYGSNFGYYNKQISRPISKDKKEVLESSWFSRGNIIMFTGFRRGNQFVPRKYRDSVYQFTVAKIDEIDDQGNLSLTTERVQV
jgi:DNA polymerase-3 subunit alpha